MIWGLLLWDRYHKLFIGINELTKYTEYKHSIFNSTLKHLFFFKKVSWLHLFGMQISLNAWVSPCPYCLFLEIFDTCFGKTLVSGIVRVAVRLNGTLRW